MLTFEECVDSCLGNRDFVSEFDRLCGTCLGGQREGSPVERMIDQATGFDEERRREDLEKFVAFVHETVWLRLPASSRAPQLVEPPPGRSFLELVGKRP